MGDPEQPNDSLAADGALEKTAKQLKKEAEKAAKLEKLKAKLEKKSAVPAVTKEKPEKKEKEAPVSATYTVDTTPGDKKDVSGAMPDAYSPQYVEASWYDWWDKQGFFKPEYGRKTIAGVAEKDKFVMMIPPPNVTGTLHLGHALTNAVEDCFVRWNRMQGKMTLWNPGCDHAGIATQVVVEKKLWRDEKKTRHELGRDTFIDRVWQWKNQKGDRIYSQLRSLGSSYDWSRARFTMEPSMCRAVSEAFIRLHESGDIYRANRLVNWSCSLKSAISDIEVDKKELSGRSLLQVPGYPHKVEVGVLLSFAYRVEGGEGEIVVATTRVETMLGDTAVAVHPTDDRYKHLVGKKLLHPFTERLLPVVADQLVDKDFGTGAVKVTPAHDPNDYELGKRHDLPFINILEDDGTISQGFGQFSGMHRYECRARLAEELQRLQLHRGQQEHAMVIPLCSRSKDIVEPMLKPQWYIKCDGMAQQAMRAVRSGELRILPASHEKIWFHWMENIRDWCISRQLWWGHRIPAYRVLLQPNHKEEEMWVSAHSEEEARRKAANKLCVAEAEVRLVRDEDVLDTWFSSALFPFAVFGWPDNTPDLQAFYPGTLLETGHDILFFWVARMVFFGQKLMGKLPFREVYLHPMVRDAHGRKMSKSLGNVVDPMDVVRGITLERLHAQLLESNLEPRELETARAAQTRDYPNGIPECGTDALRFALCAMTQGRDLNLDILRVQGYRFFCNKLWNATKFALINFPQGELYETHASTAPDAELGLMERWLLSRTAHAVHKVNAALQAYDLPAATAACYNLWLYQICDVYLEYAKPVFTGAEPAAAEAARRALYTALEVGLRLLSVFMPYITEELYQRLPRRNTACVSICVAPYPNISDAPWRDKGLETDVDTVLALVHQIRSTRSDYGLHHKQRTTAHLELAVDPPTAQRLTRLFSLLSPLAASVPSAAPPPPACAVLTHSHAVSVHLVLKGLIDPDKELSKLSKKREQLESSMCRAVTAAAASDYLTKVPEEVRRANDERLAAARADLERLAAATRTLLTVRDAGDA